MQGVESELGTRLVLIPDALEIRVSRDIAVDGHTHFAKPMSAFLVS